MDSSTAGTSTADRCSVTPYRHAPTSSASTVPGTDSRAFTENDAATAAERGTGIDQITSKVPDRRCDATFAGTRTNPIGTRASVGTPVVMSSAVVGSTSG